MHLDNFDRHLLKLLQNNSKLTTEQLGDKVGLSATACQRRIKKLRDANVIVAVLDRISMGGYVTVIVEIVMKQGGASVMDDFKAQVLQHDEIQQCYYTTGDNDFIVIVTVPNMARYEELTRAVFFKNKNIKKFNSTVVMDNVKLGLNIPVE